VPAPKHRPAEEKDLVRLRIAGVPEHFNLPWHLGLERRAFVRAGVDLKWRTVPEGTGAMCKLLRNGEVDMAVLVMEGAVKDILGGNPSRIVSQFVDTPLTWGVHVGAHTALHTPADLKGIPFAISRFNSGSHLMALSYAQQLGWSPTEKDFIVVNDLEGAVQRLKAPEPAVFLWEKYITAAHVHSGGLRRVDEFRPTWPCFVVVARNEVLEAHAKEVALTLKVVRDQARGLMAKRTAPEMIAQRYGLTVDDAREWFGGVRWNLAGGVDEPSIGAVYAVLHQVGMIAAPGPSDHIAALVAKPM
jgi:ABC-type nitrate/sulfonate/bicarbonate transport system substrate-binding protein